MPVPATTQNTPSDIMAASAVFRIRRLRLRTGPVPARARCRQVKLSGPVGAARPGAWSGRGDPDQPTRSRPATARTVPSIRVISAMTCGLLPMTQTAMRFSTVADHDYAGVAVDLDEQKRIVDDLGDADLMIPRNHGLLVVGPDRAAGLQLRAHPRCAGADDRGRLRGDDGIVSGGPGDHLADLPPRPADDLARPRDGRASLAGLNGSGSEQGDDDTDERPPAMGANRARIEIRRMSVMAAFPCRLAPGSGRRGGSQGGGIDLSSGGTNIGALSKPQPR